MSANKEPTHHLLVEMSSVAASNIILKSPCNRRVVRSILAAAPRRPALRLLPSTAPRSSLRQLSCSETRSSLRTFAVLAARSSYSSSASTEESNMAKVKAIRVHELGGPEVRPEQTPIWSFSWVITACVPPCFRYRFWNGKRWKLGSLRRERSGWGTRP